MRSDSCIGKISGKPLSVYFTEFEAQWAAEYSEVNYGNALKPYECNKCGYWHLSPSNRVTPSKKCDWCTGSDGYPKDTYRTRKEASNRADIIYEEQGILLKVYECRYGLGWHLTKRF